LNFDPALATLLGRLHDEMAFLLASPMSRARPICAYTSFAEPAHPEGTQCAEDAQRHRQQHRQRDEPALVLGGQDEEHEERGQGEDEPRPAPRLDLLEGEARPLVRHARRREVRATSCMAAMA